MAENQRGQDIPEIDEDAMRRLQRAEAVSGDDRYDIDNDVYATREARPTINDERLQDGRPQAPSFVDTYDYTPTDPTTSVEFEDEEDEDVIRIKCDHRNESDRYARYMTSANDVTATPKKKAAAAWSPQKKTFVVSAICIASALILGVLLFLLISLIRTPGQRVTPDKQRYIDAVEKVGSVCCLEDAAVRQIKLDTDAYVTGQMSLADYRDNLAANSQHLTQIVQDVRTDIYEGLFDSVTESATLLEHMCTNSSDAAVLLLSYCDANLLYAEKVAWQGEDHGDEPMPERYQNVTSYAKMSFVSAFNEKTVVRDTLYASLTGSLQQEADRLGVTAVREGQSLVYNLDYAGGRT